MTMALSQFADFIELFEKWNRSINLSAARTRGEIEEHVLDSLAVVPHVRGCSRVLDVGSGGGFPLIVAAMSLPDVSFTGLEPVHKKHAFLRTAARELALVNLTVLAERHEGHGGRDYDAAMSRATFDLAQWFQIGRRFVRPGGVILGFEAVPRNDVSPTLTRHPYQLGEKTRAIVVERL